MKTADTHDHGAWAEHLYGDAATLHDAVATLITRACAEAVASRGQALLALAGGQTPLPIYRQLARAHLPWARAVLVPTDERCVAHDHPANNARALAEACAEARGVRVLALAPSDGDAADAEAHARRELAAQAARFDVVLLGMGGDGHVASLFPGAAGLAAALDPESPLDAVRIDPVPLPPEAPFPRVSLTLARLLRARACHLVIQGEAKLRVLRTATVGTDPLACPVAAVLHNGRLPVHVHWSP